MKRKDKVSIGWQEWCSLPELKIPAIKARIDTGAKTSALHAFNVSEFVRNQHKWVKFELHPIQGRDDICCQCKAPLIDIRKVISSNGHFEHRYVIKTALTLGALSWEIEVTLSNRDPLQFRMLLGREALSSRVIIDPAKKMRQGKLHHRELLSLYFYGE